MTTASTGLSHPASHGGFRRFSVAEYHQMIRAGILDDDDRVELLEGVVVLKMPHNPPHDGTVQRVRNRLPRYLPAGWDVRVQSAITLDDSEPEPDLAVARGDDSTYLARHPGPADLGLVVEVADSSLGRDRSVKTRVYAAAALPAYWIVNLIDRQVKVFTLPSGPAQNRAYASHEIFPPGTQVRLVLDGVQVASVAVADLLP